MLTIVAFFLSSSFFLKLILQLESNTLYRRGSKHEIVGLGSYLLFSIPLSLSLSLSLSLNLDYIFHSSVNLFWMYTFIFYIGGSKVKYKRGIITTKCNCVYLFNFMKDCVYIKVHTSFRAQTLVYFFGKN